MFLNRRNNKRKTKCAKSELLKRGKNERKKRPCNGYAGFIWRGERFYCERHKQVGLLVSPDSFSRITGPDRPLYYLPICMKASYWFWESLSMASPEEKRKVLGPTFI